MNQYEEEYTRRDPSEEYRWYIALLGGDGSYRFVAPGTLLAAEKFIGKNGGAIYTHAGYLIFASSKRWWHWLMDKYEQKYKDTPIHKRPPHIDVPNIECSFSDAALKWLEENEETLLKSKGGKFYENLPKH